MFCFSLRNATRIAVAKQFAGEYVVGSNLAVSRSTSGFLYTQLQHNRVRATLPRTQRQIHNTLRLWELREKATN